MGGPPVIFSVASTPRSVGLRKLGSDSVTVEEVQQGMYSIDDEVPSEGWLRQALLIAPSWGIGGERLTEIRRIALVEHVSDWIEFGYAVWRPQ